MNVGIIGAGKLGCTLARVLKTSGWEISGVYSKSPESAAWLAKEVDGIFPNDLKTTVEQAGIIFITVNDDAIETIVAKIVTKFKRKPGLPLSGKAFFHCSGAKSSEILAPLRELGADIASLHPLMTFASREMNIDDIPGISFCVEGNNHCIALAIEIADLIEVNLIFLNAPEDKPLYHVAACFVSNYLTTLIDLSCAIFSEIKIPPKEAIAHCLPLIYSSLENTIEMGPAEALTGPIARGDFSTVKTHIDAINSRMPWLSDAYRVLGMYTAAAAISNPGNKITPQKYSKIVKLLEEVHSSE